MDVTAAVINYVCHNFVYVMFIIEVIATDELAVAKHLPFVPCPMATVQQIVFNVFVGQCWSKVLVATPS